MSRARVIYIEQTSAPLTGAVSAQVTDQGAAHIMPDLTTQVTTEEAPTAWIVRVDGHEFVHGGEYELRFDLPEAAAQFASDLLVEYGPDTQVQVVGLDELGMPLSGALPTPEVTATLGEWLAEVDVPVPEVRHPLDALQGQVCRALFIEGSAREKVALILGLYRHHLSPAQCRMLRRLDAAFVVVRFKAALDPAWVQYAEWEAAFRRARRAQTGG